MKKIPAKKAPKKPVKGVKAPAKASPEKNGTLKPAKAPAAPAVAKKPVARKGSMYGRILKLAAWATAKKPVSKGQLFDTLRAEFPDKKDSDIDMWLNYWPGYARQAGHTVHVQGKGPERTFWAELNTHAPFGRFAKKGE